ncbi:MAG: PKD domain-containing protein [Blastococcus sp.]|nr:PKD domain-containing protein [Blastococcus sp.]
MQRTTASLLTGALAAGTFIGLATLVPGIASASCAGPITVTEENKQGWTIPSFLRGTGSASFQPAPDNLVLDAPTSTTNNSKVTIAYGIAGGVPLADQTAQSNYALASERFDGKPNTTATGSATYEMVVDPDGAGTLGNTTLVFEDYYQAANPDTWWSTQPLANIPDREGHGRADWGTLAEISAAYPAAVIKSFGVNLNALPNGDAAKVSVDSVKFGCNVFTFDGGVAEPVNEAPIAVLEATGPTSEGDVTFTAPSTDDKGVVRQTLDFGDDSPVVEGGPTDRGPITHRYTPGTYTATLTAFDAEGESSTDTFTFTYTAPNDGIANGPLPETGANVIGLAVIGGVAVAGAGSGLVLRNRRRSNSAV